MHNRIALLWVLLVVLVATIALLPLILHDIEFPFLTYNLVYIVMFFVGIKYTFFLKHSRWSKMEWIKLVIVFLMIPAVILLIDGLSEFVFFVDERGINSILEKLNFDDQRSVGTYLRIEYLFFGVGSIFVMILMPLRMILSIWRVRNRNTV